MRPGPPPEHKHLDRRGGTQFSGGLWRRAGSAGTAEGGTRISILVFLFRHRYGNPGGPDRLAIAADPKEHSGLRQEQTSRRTSIKSTVAGFFAESDASGHRNAKGLYSSEIAIWPGRSNSATALALRRRCCRGRVLDRPRRDGSDIAERAFPRSEVKRSRRHDISGLAIHGSGRRIS